MRTLPGPVSDAAVALVVVTCAFRLRLRGRPGVLQEHPRLQGARNIHARDLRRVMLGGLRAFRRGRNRA